MIHRHDERAFSGSELKFAVDIECKGFDMDRDEFAVTLRRKSSGRILATIDKSRMLRRADGAWIMTFDTEGWAPGEIDAVVTAYVPDDDFADGLRTEVQRLPLIRIGG